MSGDLKRKKEADKLTIDAFGPLDLSKKSDIAACGLSTDVVLFAKRNEKFVKAIGKSFKNMEGVAPEDRDNATAMVVSHLEATFSTREICFLLAKSFLADLSTQAEAAQAQDQATKSTSK